MWMLILPVAGIAAIAFAIAMALAPPTGAKPTPKQARRTDADQTSRWENAGTDRRNAR